MEPQLGLHLALNARTPQRRPEPRPNASPQPHPSSRSLHNLILPPARSTTRSEPLRSHSGEGSWHGRDIKRPIIDRALATLAEALGAEGREDSRRSFHPSPNTLTRTSAPPSDPLASPSAPATPP